MKHNRDGFAHLILIILTVVVIAAVGLVTFKTINSRPQPEPVLTHNFLDTATIDKISKFRSCQGHVVVPQDGSELTRNMKHYVLLKEQYQGTKANVYAPFDGVVGSVFSDPSNGLEGEIWLGNPRNDWKFSMEHVKVADGIKEGSKVKAGQVIGTVGDRGVDAVYATSGDGTKVIQGYESPFGALDSVFNHMSDELKAEYAAHGVDVADMSYSKEYRDMNPCQLEPNGPSAAQLNDHDHPEDWVYVK